MYEVKQIIVVRKDLNMRRGKEIAQSCHASMAVFLNDSRIFNKNRPDLDKILMIDLWPESLEWLEEKFTKVCLQVNSEQELLDVYNKAKAAGIPSAVIKDSGKTEFNGVPTYTCCAIGPYESEEINKITGHLKLY